MQSATKILFSKTVSDAEISMVNSESENLTAISVSANLLPEKNSADAPASEVTLPYEMPQAEYMHGCTATVVGMLLGYYDRYGYSGIDFSDLIDGEVELNARGTDGNKYDMDAFDTVLGRAICSKEHVKYFVDTTYESEYSYTLKASGQELQTQYWNCIADYLGTGQYWRSNESDNGTTYYNNSSLKNVKSWTSTETISANGFKANVPQKFFDMLYGLDLYVSAKGYQLDENQTAHHTVDCNGGYFTFEDYKAEIDAGRGVILHIEDHSILGYGYDDVSKEIIFDDTYRNICRMKWNGTYYYGGAERKLLAATTVVMSVGNVPVDPVVSGNHLSWSVNEKTGFILELSKNNFKTSISINLQDTDLDLLNISEGSYQWRVRSDESKGWTSGRNFTAENSPELQKWNVSDSDAPAIFFAEKTGVWGYGYRAENQGAYGGWKGSENMVDPAGKNRFGDIFSSQNRKTVLVLTDDSNGDAFFIDDDFTAFPDDNDGKVRASGIAEIRAGAGDDIVDLTSAVFIYGNEGTRVYGGSGNDVLWGNLGRNQLFGDAGNDMLEGNSGNDLLVGGSGDDHLICAGGNDTVAFSANWGNDTIEQCATSATLTLWFAEGSLANWNADTLTYRDGSNSVKVDGIKEAKIFLKFGNDGSDKYTEISAAGAFVDSASENIFEDQNKGFIA